MSETYITGGKITLTRKLSPGDTSLYASSDLGIDAGRLYFVNADQVEWISFSAVNASGSEYIYSGLVRQLSTTADPATSLGNGYTWLAATEAKLVAMHDQIPDKLIPTQYLIAAKTYATTAARDAALGGDGVAVYPYTGIYVTATGLHYNYNLSSGQWESVDTGTTTPNASDTEAGKVEIATTAQSKSGTDTGETGAKTLVLPSDIAANTQSGTFVYAVDAGANDTYVIALTPALTAYTTGMSIRVKFNTANTGACTLNVNSLGAKSIKLRDGTDPLDGDIPALSILDLIYDGTNFVVDASTRASDAEALAGTNTTKFISPKQAKLNYGTRSQGVFARAPDATSNTQTIAHGLGKTPTLVEVKADYVLNSNGDVDAHSFGTYNGTNTNCIYWSNQNGTGVTGNSTTNGVVVATTGMSHVATIAFDATNITLTWTSSGWSGTTNVQVLWKAQ